MGRAEYEISVGEPFCSDVNKLVKIDCYEQCRKNIKAITHECIRQYKEQKKNLTKKDVDKQKHL